MRLLDAVRTWDDTAIECVTATHRAADNPLRLDGALPAVCGLEYGAQAMAIHGALLARRAHKPAVGLLVAAHELCWRVPRLDTVASDLVVRATCLLGSERQVAYEFVLSADGAVLVAGRAAVILEVEP